MLSNAGIVHSLRSYGQIALPLIVDAPSQPQIVEFCRPWYDGREIDRLSGS
jgi:hypothetical protein